MAVALLLVVYPLREAPQHVDFDTAPLSLSEAWAFQLTTASRGYFGGWGDRRWVLDSQYRELAAFLRGEIDAGRIVYGTHVLQITPAVNRVEVALGTGISVDILSPEFDPSNIWTGLGRARSLEELPEKLQSRPAYVLVEQYPKERFPELTADYEVAFSRPPAFQLLRRRGATTETQGS